jgi:hypothetical protein
MARRSASRNSRRTPHMPGNPAMGCAAWATTLFRTDALVRGDARRRTRQRARLRQRTSSRTCAATTRFVYDFARKRQFGQGERESGLPGATWGRSRLTTRTWTMDAGPGLQPSQTRCGLSTRWRPRRRQSLFNDAPNRRNGTAMVRWCWRVVHHLAARCTGRKRRPLCGSTVLDSRGTPSLFEGVIVAATAASSGPHHRQERGDPRGR